MTQSVPYQPGAILHAAILGAFKAQGLSFEKWCARNGVHAATMRNVTYGQSKGVAGQEMLARVIAAAGPEMVDVAYRTRMAAHVADLKAGRA